MCEILKKIIFNSHSTNVTCPSHFLKIDKAGRQDFRLKSFSEILLISPRRHLTFVKYSIRSNIYIVHVFYLNLIWYWSLSNWWSIRWGTLSLIDRSPIKQITYSVMQSYQNDFFCYVVLYSVNMYIGMRGNILEQIYEQQICWIFAMMILNQIYEFLFEKWRYDLYMHFLNQLEKPTKRGEGVRGCPLRKKNFFRCSFLICNRWKNNYILFKTTYPNINISVVVYCVLVVGGKTHRL